MSRRAWAAVALAALALGGGWLAAARIAPGAARPGVRAALPVTQALGAGDPAGYARADRPRPFAFPEDHGPHPGFRTEWWYYTGNLLTAEGRHFGFQLTFFRQALAPGEPPPGSAWRTTQAHLAHFALTDTEGGRFHAAWRTGRAALGLAGARARPFRVWLDDWTAESAAPGALPMRLSAREGDVAIDLVLDSAKPPVLQGDAGLSRKGPEPGNASYYYSFTRMPARGTVALAGRSFAVRGLAWMDREWSTSALGPDLAGWDWFAFQLDDGRELMFYQLRRRDGATDPHSAGSLVDVAGGARRLGPADARVEVTGEWASPRSGARYPSGWRVAAAGLALEVAPRLPDQELDVGTRYWEGAVTVRGAEGGRPVSGVGYVELVGYGEGPAAGQGGRRGR
jgi:predicted secreted hydrolase